MKYFISENAISQVLKVVAGAILIYAVFGFFVSVYLIEDGDFLMVSSSFLMDQIFKVALLFGVAELIDLVYKLKEEK